MKIIAITLLLLCSTPICSADKTNADTSGVSYRTIRVVGRAESVVTNAAFALGDVADITSPRSEDDDAVLALRRMPVAASPAPGASMTLYGETVLGMMRKDGVVLDQLVYSLPRELKITRAYREIPLQEVERAVRSFLDAGGRDIQIKKIDYQQPFRVSPSAKPIEAIAIKTMQPGQVGFDLKSADGANDSRFQLKAMVDEWRMIPVARRSIAKGSSLAGADVEMRSFNAALLPKDVLQDPSEVIGTVSSRDIGEGEPLKRAMVSMPPLIAAGAHVFIAFKSGLLEATATGTALDNGFRGQEIRVRNDSSNKTISAIVEDGGVVRVGGSSR